MSPSRDGNQVVAKQHGNGPPSVFREYGMGVFRFAASTFKGMTQGGDDSCNSQIPEGFCKVPYFKEEVCLCV
jgi:hypothetical protein